MGAKGLRREVDLIFDQNSHATRDQDPTIQIATRRVVTMRRELEKNHEMKKQASELIENFKATQEGNRGKEA